MLYNCEQGVLLQALKQGLLAAAVTYPRSCEGLVKSVPGLVGLAAAKGWSRSCEDHVKSFVECQTSHSSTLSLCLSLCSFSSYMAACFMIITMTFQLILHHLCFHYICLHCWCLIKQSNGKQVCNPTHFFGPCLPLHHRITEMLQNMSKIHSSQPPSRVLEQNEGVENTRKGGFELCFGVKNFSFLFFEGFSLLLKRKREQGSRRWTRYFILVHLQTTSYIQSTPQGDLALRTR